MTGSSPGEDEIDRMQAKILAAMDEPETAQRVPDWKTPHDLTRMGLSTGQIPGVPGSGAYDGGVRWAVRWAEEGSRTVICECPDGEQAAREFHASIARRYIERGRTDRPELLTARVVWQLAT